MLGEIDDAMRLGLWLNKERQDTRRAGGVLGAIATALSGTIGPEWLEAFKDGDAN